MLKSDAVAAFGSQSAIAKALGVTRAYVSQWPEELPERIADRVLGAAVRLGLTVQTLGAPRRDNQARI